jgi:hypothetical protein
MREMLGQQAFNRRKVLVSLISTAPVAALAFSREAIAKVAQRAVQYQPTPKGGLSCAGCNSFIAPSACKLVAGEISPSGWCHLWTKKEG